MIRTEGIWFKDEQGRRLLLRGVNLGGSSKVPYPHGATYKSEGFFEHRQVSFVGRPFPLDEADEHFQRLKAWGLTFLRFLVTWEAVEHAGPGRYDQAYLDYLQAVVAKAGEHGFLLFIDPHQDVWSRFSGGDGAPGWTLEAVGFELRNFAETGAAITHQARGDLLPRMIWPTNDYKLAAASMWTLFFGGNDFAPHTKIEGEPVQNYLQRHYFAAMQQVAERLKGFEHMLGYDILNEPHGGYIGHADLSKASWQLKIGPTPSPFQSMLLGAGIPQEVETYRITPIGFRRQPAQLLNPEGLRAWQAGHDCIWMANGVWDVVAGHPRLLRPGHFQQVERRRVDFNRDYLRPFASRYARAIRQVDPQALVFVEFGPGETPAWRDSDAERIIFSPHWYDGHVLMLKDFIPWLGVDRYKRKLVISSRRIRKSFAEQIGGFKEQAQTRLGGVPTVIGEVGIPFDLKDKAAYRSGDFRTAIRAMDRSLRAMDDTLVSYTLWNYTADNSNARGDQWNDEDLSIFSCDQRDNPDDLNSGGRALEAVVRPYAMKINGEPLRMSFDLKHRHFQFEFRHDPEVVAPTEIFVPNFQYPHGIVVKLSDGRIDYHRDQQQLIYHHSADRSTHQLQIRPKG